MKLTYYYTCTAVIIQAYNDNVNNCDHGILPKDSTLLQWHTSNGHIAAIKALSGTKLTSLW